MATAPSVLIASDRKIGLEELSLVPCPLGTATHRPIPHHEVVQALVETLGFRHIGVHNMEFAVDRTGNKMFGLMELDQGFNGARFALGIRNSHSKVFRLSIVVGLRIFVCSNLCFSGDFNIVLAKHSKHFLLTNAISVGIDEAQRGFAPMQQRVEAWRQLLISDYQARLHIFQAFIENQLEAPKHLAREVWHNWTAPAHEEFQPRTAYALQNAYTSSFKLLDPIPAYKATASLAQLFSN